MLLLISRQQAASNTLLMMLSAKALAGVRPISNSVIICMVAQMIHHDAKSNLNCLSDKDDTAKVDRFNEQKPYCFATNARLLSALPVCKYRHLPLH